MIFLSFDIEEFDVPYEYNLGYRIMEEGLNISKYGTLRILELLKQENIKATFFCTTNFAENSLDIIKHIIDDGHEVASHGCNHFNPREIDIKESKLTLERITKGPILGYRQPRMQYPNVDILIKGGYEYSASLNPTLIPGRYMNLFKNRRPYLKTGIIQIPASVTPILRIPLFWCALHLFPLSFYEFLCNWTIKCDKHLNVYFHPWEFYPLESLSHLNIPFILRKNSGDKLYHRLQQFIKDFRCLGYEFGTYKDYINIIRHSL